MTTNELVTLIAEYVGSGWTRQRILEALNRTQNEILGMDNQICLVTPNPFLATTDLTYVYAASSYLYASATGAQGSLIGDIRAVRKIYSRVASLNLSPNYALDPPSAKYYKIERDRVSIHAGFVDSAEPDSEDCSIKWPSGYNPGDTTITWEAVAYTWPTQLISEEIALTMPSDFHDTYLLSGTLKRLEPREFGQPGVHLNLYAAEKKRFNSKYSGLPNQDGPLEASPLIC